MRRTVESPFYTPGEVAAMFRVDPKTVTRWAATGKLAHGVITTPGGHRRFRKTYIDSLVAAESEA